MATFTSYELNGKKLSFANWISNLSPTDTFFTSATGKEAIQQTLFQWQTDRLAPAADNAVVEGSPAAEGTVVPSVTKSNETQILRKVVKVSDTANALANYGRGRELQYQMEKAGKEIKRDLEKLLLDGKQSHIQGDASAKARQTAGFIGQIADGKAVIGGVATDGTTPVVHAAAAAADPDTGAVVYKTVADPYTFDKVTGVQTAAGAITEAELFDVTAALYIAGAEPDTIMFHPMHAGFFSSLQEKSTGGTRTRMFENTPKVSVFVSELVDPLGQSFKLVPNRFADPKYIYIFNPADWTQMILRAPQRTQLAKDGSYEKWMIEMEVGLRHRNPYASGLLIVGELTV